jgi:hypothetical protein
VRGRSEEEAERLLREYLGGANERGQRLDLTTPLWRSSDGAVSFALAGLQVRGLPAHAATHCAHLQCYAPTLSGFAQSAAPGLQSSKCLLSSSWIIVDEQRVWPKQPRLSETGL